MTLYSGEGWGFIGNIFLVNLMGGVWLCWGVWHKQLPTHRVAFLGRASYTAITFSIMSTINLFDGGGPDWTGKGSPLGIFIPWRRVEIPPPSQLVPVHWARTTPVIRNATQAMSPRPPNLLYVTSISNSNALWSFSSLHCDTRKYKILDENQNQWFTLSKTKVSQDEVNLF
jgi:hypothetical protein